MLNLLPLAFIATTWMATHIMVGRHHENVKIGLNNIFRIDRELEYLNSVLIWVLSSRQIFVDFCSMEGYTYPEEFPVLVEAIDAEPFSPLAIRYRSVMKEILIPMQNLVVEKIVSKNYLLNDDDKDESLSRLVSDFVELASNYRGY